MSNAAPMPVLPSQAVVVFLDYQNLYMSARETFYPPRQPGDPPLPWVAGQFDPLKLAQRIVARAPATSPRHLKQVRIYRGEPRFGVASGGQSGRVTLWEAPSGRLLATLGAHEGPVWGIVFSRDARLLVSGGVDGTVMLWDVATRQLLARLTGHDGPINDVAVSPDGSLIASSSQDGAVKLWDAESGACRATLRPDRRYERMDITGLTGVSDVQKMVLRNLGAVERAP